MYKMNIKVKYLDRLRRISDERGGTMEPSGDDAKKRSGWIIREESEKIGLTLF